MLTAIHTRLETVLRHSGTQKNLKINTLIKKYSQSSHYNLLLYKIDKIPCTYVFLCDGLDA
jgi:hypothetical protein